MPLCAERSCMRDSFPRIQEHVRKQKNTLDPLDIFKNIADV